MCLENNITPKKFIKKITTNSITLSVTTIKDIRFHSITNLAVNGKPENNKIKNQMCFVIFGNVMFKPLIYCNDLVE
jgi:hypothetical protein